MAARTRPILLGGAGLALLCACLAPEDRFGDAESYAEFERRLAESTKGLVEAQVEEGATATLGQAGEGEGPIDPTGAQARTPAPVTPGQNPYLRFGERIEVHEVDGITFVTKPYFMPANRPRRLVDLMTVLHPFAFREYPVTDIGKMAEAPPEAGVVELVILDDWDSEQYSNFQQVPPVAPAPPTEVAISDLLVVTATPDLLERFESFIDTFAAGVPQIEIEAKIIEIVEDESLDIGVKGVDGLPIFQFGSANFVRSLDFDLPNTTSPSEALLNIGAVQDGVAFNALIEAIQGWQNVSIESRPRTVVRAGGLARIESTQEVPFYAIGSINNAGGFNASLQFKPVGIKLYISPRVVGTRTLALDVQLEASQQTGTSVSFVTDNGSEIANPIIAIRTAKTVVYLEPGQTLVIGGLTNERNEERVNKVPLLGDIPVLGHLFRSTFTQKVKQHVMFAISPRIVQKSELNTDI